jgi:hypothetical protein
MENSENKAKQKKYKELMEKIKKRIRQNRQHLKNYDKETSSDVYTSGEIQFRLYCHFVGYGDQLPKLIDEDR